MYMYIPPVVMFTTPWIDPYHQSLDPCHQLHSTRDPPCHYGTLHWFFGSQHHIALAYGSQAGKSHIAAAASLLKQIARYISIAYT